MPDFIPPAEWHSATDDEITQAEAGTLTMALKSARELDAATATVYLYKDDQVVGFASVLDVDDLITGTIFRANPGPTVIHLWPAWLPTHLPST